MSSEDQISGEGDQPKKFQIILKSAHVCNHDETIDGDILIENGIIRKIGRNISAFGDNVRVIDCAGKYVIPGGIDVNTHLLGKLTNSVSADDFYTGTMSALNGGTTTIIDTINIEDGSTSFLNRINEIRERADSQVCCDYGLHVGIRNFNEKIASELQILLDYCGVNSFKIDLRDENSNFFDDRKLYDFFQYSKCHGVLVLVNAANGRLMEKKANEIYKLGITGPEGHLYSCSEELEFDSVHHIITVSNETNCPVLFTNVMSQPTAKLIAKFKGQGSIIYGEIIAASLAMDIINVSERSWNQAAALITESPLRRDTYTVQKMIQHLATGGMDISSSNHHKCSLQMKQTGLDDFRKIPSGITGLTERMMIVWDKGVNSGVFDCCQFVAVTSANAAKLFNLYPQKGCIKEGSDADIVIWDPKAVRQKNSDETRNKCFVDIYENLKICGSPVTVIANGKIVYENNKLDVKAGSGKFLNLHSNSQFVYKKVYLKDKLYAQSLRKVIRDPVVTTYEETKNDVFSNSNQFIEPNITNKINQRATTRCGGRNMQDSTFSLSGSQIDDNKPIRSSIRAQQPPGGVSTFPW